MRHHEHLPPFNNEPNWEDREKFGRFGYQLPFMADIYASGYELARVTKAHGDDRSNNPYNESPDGLWDDSIRSFNLSHVHNAARYFLGSPRDGHRVFAAELLAAKQKHILYRLEDPRIHVNEIDVASGPFDPGFEMQSWLSALEGDISIPVLEEYWDFLGIVADDDDAREHVPRDTTVDDFEPLLSSAYTRMVRAAASSAQ